MTEPATSRGRPGEAAALPPDPAQAVRRGAARRSPVRRRPGGLRVHRPPGRGDPRPRRPGRDRRRRRQHLPRPGRLGARDGPRDRRLHRHARHGHERPGAPGRPRAGRRADPGHDRDRDERGRRAVHPAPRHPPPREGPRRDLRGRHRQPVLHDRHRGRPARRRDQRRGPAQGDQGRRRLRQGPDGAPRCAALRSPRVRRPAPRPAQGPRRDGREPVHGERPADRRVRPQSARQHHAGRRRRAGRDPHLGRLEAPPEVRQHEHRDHRRRRPQDGPRGRGHGARLPGHPHRPRLDRRSSSASTSTTTARRRRSTSWPGSASRSRTRSSSSRGTGASSARSRRRSPRATSG